MKELGDGGVWEAERVEGLERVGEVEGLGRWGGGGR